MQLTLRHRCLAVPVALSVFAHLSAAEPASSVPRVSVVRTPNGGIQPQAVVDGDGMLHLIYFQGDPAAGELFYVRRRGEQPFSAPIQINSHPGSAIAAGTIRGAQLPVGKGPAGTAAAASLGDSDRIPTAEFNLPVLLYFIACGDSQLFFKMPAALFCRRGMSTPLWHC